MSHILVTHTPHGDLQITDSDVERAREAARAYGIQWTTPFDVPPSGFLPRLLTSEAHALLMAASLTRTGWKPEDPMRVKARKIAAEAYRGMKIPPNQDFLQRVEKGELDHGVAVRAALAALSANTRDPHAYAKAA